MTGPSGDDGRITRLLRAARNGDQAAFDEVYAALYDELRRMARGVRRGHRNQTLDTTALVHEAYLKLLPSAGGSGTDRAHFCSIAARAMRQVLVDAARRGAATKRGGGRVRVELREEVVGPAETGRPGLEDVLTLDRLLRELEELDARQAEIVQCRVFGGLPVADTAAALGVSEPTVKRDWRMARAWLAHRLRDA